MNSLERLLDASLIAFVMSEEGLFKDFSDVNHFAMEKHGRVFLKIPDILLYHTNYIQTLVLLRLIYSLVLHRVKLYCPFWDILIICDYTIYLLTFSVYPKIDYVAKIRYTEFLDRLRSVHIKQF